MKSSCQLKREFRQAVLIIIGSVFFFGESSFGQQKSPLWGNLPAGKYAVGYKNLAEKDGSRSLLQKNGALFAPAERLIRISLWYPAQNSDPAKPKMKFSEYVSAMNGLTVDAEKSANQNRFKNSSLVQELPEAAAANLLLIQTSGTINAPFATDKKFPVVIFGQGLFHESPITHTVLCEFLASHGFIVATTDLIGARSPFVKLDAVDLEAAVRDLEFVASRARRLPGADPEKLGVVGFDMGGLAGLLLTMRNAEVDVFASLDSGIAAAHNLRLVKAMTDYDPSNIRVPLFHATHPVEELARFNVSEDASFLNAARYSDRLVLRFPDMRHADFTSRPMIEFFAAKMQDEATLNRRRSFETAAQSLLTFLQAHLEKNRQSLESLYNSAKVVSDSKVKFTKERKPALLRLPVTEDEFFNRLYTEGAEKTAALFRKIRSQFPNEQIFREAALNQIGYNRLYRGEAQEAIRIFSLNAEAYPHSANAFDSLADAYRITGNNERAIFNYRKSLEINPNNENAKERLKQLEVVNKPAGKKSDSKDSPQQSSKLNVTNLMPNFWEFWKVAEKMDSETQIRLFREKFIETANRDIAYFHKPQSLRNDYLLVSFLFRHERFDVN